MRGLRRSALLVAASLLLPAVLLGAPSVRALGQDSWGEDSKEETKKETRPVIDGTQVYFGKASTCKAPAVVDADQVYRAIPEYRKIVDQKLTDKDAEYSLLLVKATKKFRSAVEAAAVENSCDLVANVGAVKWEGHEVPDLTDAALRKVEELARGNP